MRIFVTGASGFVGSAITKELIQAGHQVLGMVRSDSGAEKVTKAGATPHRGDIYDLESIKQGAAECEAIIHTAFNHDFSNFKANCETDRKVVETLGSVVAGSEVPLIITSGVGLLNYGRLVSEDDVPPAGSEAIPRVASEEAAKAAADKGSKVYIVRLPPTVHDKGDHGFIPIVINAAKQKGESAYIGEGKNQWPAVNRQDAAKLYRLIAEQKPEQNVFHAVAEQGIEFHDIAGAIGKGLNIPVVSKTGKEAEDHFGWFTHFASLNCPSSSTKSQKALNWQPTHTTLLEDLAAGFYF